MPNRAERNLHSPFDIGEFALALGSVEKLGIGRSLLHV